MSGANIFVMYASADGKNVTVSPRLGKGEVEPDYNSAAKITLLEGSGVVGDTMTANVLCSSCNTWSGGSMDFSDSSAGWIYAYKSGTPLKSNSLSKDIDQHSSAAGFTWPLSAAKGGSDNVNPFVVAPGKSTKSGSGAKPTVVPASCTPVADSVASNTASITKAYKLSEPTGSGCPSAWPSQYSTAWPKNPPAWVTACMGSGSYPTEAPKIKRDSDCPAGYAPISSNVGSSDEGEGISASQDKWMPLTHGVLASLAFVALFPMGGILIRIANFTGLVWVHAALQMLAYIIYLIAFAMGVYMATRMDYMSRAHPIIGTVLFVVLCLQPIFGVVHHMLFKKQGRRTVWSYLHLYQGRIAILLGMINGGLGIQLAGDASTGARAAYAIITLIMAVLYIACIVIGERRRSRDGPPALEKSQKAHQLRDLHSSEGDVRNYSIRHDRLYE